MNKLPSAPVHLIVGPEEQAILFIEEQLQTQLCKHADQAAAQSQEINCFCKICRKIKQRQHASLVWLDPGESYSVKDVDIIFERTQFALDSGTQFFFVMPRVHTLNLATANKMLKVLEEPPIGYHFFLYTNNIHAILPTILSRCVVYYLTVEQQTEKLHPILNYLCDPSKAADPFSFEALVKKEHLSDGQSFELLNNLLNHYVHKLKNLSSKPELDLQDREEQEYYQQVIEFVTQALKRPPQSGSSEIFWKLLFMTFPQR